MNTDSLKAKLREYAGHIQTIRKLSAVSLEGIADGTGYADKLRADYKRIGELGEVCRNILSDTVYPLLGKKDHLSAEDVYALQDFCEILIDPTSGEELDLFLLYEVSDRLLYELSYLGDEDRYAQQLNTHVSVCYANVNRTARLTISREICTFYRDRGLDAANRALEYIDDKSRFLRLGNGARIYILRVARFYSALYDTFYFETLTNERRYQALVTAIRISEDPFFRENVTDYNWRLHRIRCIEHMGQLTERGNRWGFTPSQCRDICEWLGQLAAIRDEDAKEFDRILPEAHYRLLIHRNAYFAGDITKSDYREGLLDMYRKYAGAESYDMYAAQMNLLLPLEYLASLRGEAVTVRDQAILRFFYDSVIDYVLRSVNLDAFNFLQEYLIGFLEEFIELPGVMSFMDMGLQCLAALHPPTYVHSLQVADISRCLTEHLIMKHPEVFEEALSGKGIGISLLGDRSRYGEGEGADVKLLDDPAMRSHIGGEIYRAAMCHDIGKITMIDSIFIYGRNLLEREYDIIHLHTQAGEKLLRQHGSTAKYADIAGEHHLWYDGSGGYPQKGGAASIVASIVSAADSIDAATDDIGRSYRRGKTLDEICGEIKSENGTRYAPYIADLMDEASVREDLTYLLTEGRKNRYRRMYQLLSGVSERRE